MTNQLRVELYKLTRFLGIYLAVIVLAGIGFSYGYIKLSVLNTISVNEVFQSVVSDTSLMFINLLVIAWFLGKDFSTRTIQNEIRIGYSRKSVLISRYIITFFAVIMMHFTWIASTLIGFIVKHGMDSNIFCFRNFIWLLIVFLQVVAVTSMVVMIEFFAKNASVAMVATAISVFIGCNVIRNYVDADVYQFTCFGLAQSGSWEVLLPAMLYAIVLMLVFGVITCLGFRKAEVK